ncbi:MAG: argininosuccinate lyase, partial [Candidatus Omnitrophota bacterium]|jgi:argininosuccinate lyase
MVKKCLDKGRPISALTVKELKSFSPKLEGDVKKILNAWASVSLKTSYGGTSPKQVEKQIKVWSKRLK